MGKNDVFTVLENHRKTKNPKSRMIIQELKLTKEKKTKNLLLTLVDKCQINWTTVPLKCRLPNKTGK